MNKRISQWVGIVTALSIICYVIVLMRLAVPMNSPWVFGQFLLLFLGLFISCALLFRYYAGIRFIEAFLHCLKTLAAALFLIIVGNVILFYIFSERSSTEQLTMLIMKTIFAYSVSGIFSAAFSSYIFYTFTKK